MSFMFASDLHGSLYYGEKVFECYEKEQPEKLILLGDLLYHGARNDFPEGYSTKGLTALLNAHKNDIIAVRGNCDSEVDQMVLEFPILADYCVIPLGSRLLYATHGHQYNRNSLPPLLPGDILLHGHTHIPAWEPFGNGSLYLNPGSVSIPKAGSRHSCMLLRENLCSWHSLEGDMYHEITL